MFRTCRSDPPITLRTRQAARVAGCRDGDSPLLRYFLPVPEDSTVQSCCKRHGMYEYARYSTSSITLINN
jgi:hypothetical protein